MILIPVLAVLFALSIDFAFGDTKNKFHPYQIKNEFKEDSRKTNRKKNSD